MYIKIKINICRRCTGQDLVIFKSGKCYNYKVVIDQTRREIGIEPIA